MIADRPRYAYETEDLARVAAHLHAQRVALYPAAVERGSLTPAEAADGIRIMAAIAADWQRRITLTATPAERDGTNAEKVETLRRAAERARQLQDREPTAQRDEYAEFVETLLWWQQPWDGDPTSPWSRLDHIIDLNVALRAAHAPRWRAMGWCDPREAIAA